jgi:uncharacterized membrane protein
MNLATAIDMILTLRLIHMLAAGFMVGAAVFNYGLLRPAIRLIPPAHGLVIRRRVATVMTYLGWISLGLLLLTGLWRMYLRDELGAFLSLELFTESHLRALVLMSLAWLIIMGLCFVMMQMVRTQLTKGTGAAMAVADPKAMTQLQSLERLDRLELWILVLSTLALLGGASMVDGGLF